MLSCHISLGQFADHERLDRTIPHKAFESLALGLPYVTARAKGILEILRDGENCFMTNPADSKALSEKIIQIKNELSATQKIRNNGFDLYKSNFTPDILAKKIISLLENLIH